MSQREFLNWCAFYELNPFDDLHRYHRPAALVATSMAGGDMSKLLTYLVNDHSEKEEATYGGLSEADMRTLAALGGKRPEI